MNRWRCLLIVSSFCFTDVGYAQTTVTTTTPAPQPTVVSSPAQTAVVTTPEPAVTVTVQPQPQPTVVVPTVPATVTQVNANYPSAVSTTSVTTINKLADVTGSSNRISLKFQNIDIRTLIQLVAKMSGQNFIISEAVKGTTTIGLTNVTWQQALNTIIQANGLAYKKIGHTILVSTLDDITAKESKQLQSAQAIAELLPLSSRMITLRYANAGAIAKMLKGPESNLLTSRGEVAVNSATNTIIIRDIRTNLREVVRFLRHLDIPTRQVEIEARIVDIDIGYEAQLGVRFGLSNTRSLSGTWNGASQLAQGVSIANVNPIDQRLNFDIPASILSTGTTPASIGLALAHLGPILLDLELSALEEEGHSKIISRPRVITANQTKASIQTGEEIPYQQATSSGATSVDFKKAVLSLEIVPQITPDNKIFLKIKATQDSRGPQLLVSQQVTSTGGTQSTTTTSTIIPAQFGPPTIITEEVESNVLLNNNETLVIGGIFKLSKTNTLDRVPFFSDLPFIGNLFKHRAIKNDRKELLFFITPRIVEPHNEYANRKGEGEKKLERCDSVA